jgi:hypothetical protein
MLHFGSSSASPRSLLRAWPAPKILISRACRTDLNLLDMLEVRSYLSDQQDPSWSAASFATAPAGEEMTRLLAYAAAQLPAGSGVVHIGTSMPYVASMAVYNPGAEVHAFDYYQHHRSACVATRRARC